MTNNESKNDTQSSEENAEPESLAERKEREALKLVEKRGYEELHNKAMKLRFVGLTAISICIAALLLTVLSGVGLYYWYNTKFVLKSSSYLIRFASENLLIIRIIHGIGAFSTVLFFVVYVVSFLNFHKVYTETPHSGKTGKVSRFITSSAGLVLLAMMILSLLSGYFIPPKHSKLTEVQHGFSTETVETSDKPISMDELSEKARKYREIGRSELKQDRVELIFLLHTTLLPLILGLLIILVLFDVYAMQKAKYSDITPKIKPH
ncbi:MAG: hypothetical protein K8S87_00100 [Planctomycetes bacterium]|nr:hypothetical protein [Planctomycetota bacterium]